MTRSAALPPIPKIFHMKNQRGAAMKCEKYEQKYPEIAWVEVTLVMSANDVRKAIQIGGFDIDDFFQGQDAVDLNKDPNMRADLADAAAYGLHTLLDCLRDGDIPIGNAANTNRKLP
jgi:hypothetical protein